MFLAAHGLVHLLYLAPDVPEFSMRTSWLVPGPARYPLALGLTVSTPVAFGVLALAVWGVPGLSGTWAPIAVVASVLSLLLLTLFWSSWLVIGLLIDVGILLTAVARPEWVERLLS